MRLSLTPLHSRIQPGWVVGLTLLNFISLARANDLPPEQVEFFEHKIRPILAQECYDCHNSRGKSKGGLILDHRAAWQAGGDSGSVIVPRNPKESLLLQTIRHELPDLKMPKAGAQLDANVLSDFEQWIAMGAPDPRDAPPTDDELARDTDWEAIRERRKGWWSFQPIEKNAPPEIPGVERPVDRFVRARLAEENLEPAPPAEPRTLLRRLHFTLVGLPPTPKETASTPCSPILGSERSGRATGWTGSATPIPTAARATPTFPMPGATGTTSSARSMPTSPTTSSCSSISPVTCSRHLGSTKIGN